MRPRLHQYGSVNATRVPSEDSPALDRADPPGIAGSGPFAHPLLGALTAEDTADVLASTRERAYQRGDVIVSEGAPPDSMHLLLRGHVAIQVVTESGDVALLRVLGAGDFFGELSLVSPAPRNATVLALDDVTTRSLTVDAFDRLRRRSPAAERLLVEALVAEVRRLSEQVRDAYYLAVPERTMVRLRELCTLYAEGEGHEVVLAFTQEELAQLVGTARPTVNKVLKDLEAQGMLRLTRGRVTIPDPTALGARPSRA